MQPDENNLALLFDMRQYAMRVVDLTSGRGAHEFVKFSEFELAIERLVEIIGEAAGKVSSTFQDAHPEIEWRAISGLRNILAHGYSQVNTQRLWQVAIEDVPELVRQLDALGIEWPDPV